MFLPMFIEIVSHTVLNLGSNLEAYGTPALRALTSDVIQVFGDGFIDTALLFILRLFSFTLVAGLLLMLSMKSKSGEVRSKSFLMLIQYLILVVLLSNYMIGRTDAGFARAALAGAVLYVATAVLLGGYLFKNTQKSRFYAVAAITLVAVLATTAGDFTATVFSRHSIIWYRPGISTEYIEFDGESAGISNLGTFYSRQAEIYHLSEISHVLDGEYSFLNLSNNAAYHSIFGKKAYEPYSSIYNTMNSAMHYQYINVVKDNLPDVALVHPGVAMDGITISIRAYPIYRWLLVQGYRPYKLNEVVFLLSEDSAKRDMYERADAEFTNYVHPGNLGYLPILWGSEGLVENRVVSTGIFPQITDMFNIAEENGVTLVTGNDAFIEYRLEIPINGLDHDFIRIKLDAPYSLRNEGDYLIYWANQGEAFHEDRNFMFRGNNGTLLIPMGSNPSWALSDTISDLRLAFPNTMTGKQLPDIHIELYSYNEGWRS